MKNCGFFVFVLTSALSVICWLTISEKQKRVGLQNLLSKLLSGDRHDDQPKPF